MLPDNNILDIIISLVLIYALLSILVSIITEWLNVQLKARALFLKETIFKLLNDPVNLNFGELFYNHYLIRKFYNADSKSLPQYISSKLFTDVLIDLLANRTKHDIPIAMVGKVGAMGKQYQALDVVEYENMLARVKAGLMSLNPSPFTDTIHSFVDKSKDMDEFKANLSFWYDDYMDRVSGWFKKNQRTKFLVIGFIVAFGLNVDSLHLLKVISIDDNLRINLVNTAEKVADNYKSLSDTAKSSSSALIGTFNSVAVDSLKDSTRIKHAGNLVMGKDEVKKRLQFNDSISIVYMKKADSVLGIASALNIPIGWDWSSAPLSWKPLHKEEVVTLPQGDGLYAYTQRRNRFSVGNMAYYLLGIFISGISLSFGAPFWFDTLVKLINIRRSGKKPEATNTTK